MCVIGRGRGGEGRNVGLIYSPPLHFFKPYHLLACVRWVMGGEGRGQWRTVKSSRVGGSSANERADSIVPDQW